MIYFLFLCPQHKQKQVETVGIYLSPSPSQEDPLITLLSSLSPLLLLPLLCLRQHRPTPMIWTVDLSVAILHRFCPYLVGFPHPLFFHWPSHIGRGQSYPLPPPPPLYSCSSPRKEKDIKTPTGTYVVPHERRIIVNPTRKNQRGIPENNLQESPIPGRSKLAPKESNSEVPEENFQQRSELAPKGINSRVSAGAFCACGV